MGLAVPPLAVHLFPTAFSGGGFWSIGSPPTMIEPRGCERATLPMRLDGPKGPFRGQMLPLDGKPACSMHAETLRVDGSCIRILTWCPLTGHTCDVLARQMHAFARHGSSTTKPVFKTYETYLKRCISSCVDPRCIVANRCRPQLLSANSTRANPSLHSPCHQ